MFLTWKGHIDSQIALETCDRTIEPRNPWVYGRFDTLKIWQRELDALVGFGKRLCGQICRKRTGKYG